jgi:hypothetical protein
MHPNQANVQALAAPCAHEWVTSTCALGPHCADCKEPLVSLFDPTSRNTVAGALLCALRQQPWSTA